MMFAKVAFALTLACQCQAGTTTAPTKSPTASPTTKTPTASPTTGSPTCGASGGALNSGVTYGSYPVTLSNATGDANWGKATSDCNNYAAYYGLRDNGNDRNYTATLYTGGESGFFINAAILNSTKIDISVSPWSAEPLNSLSGSAIASTTSGNYKTVEWTAEAGEDALVVVQWTSAWLNNVNFTITCTSYGSTCNTAAPTKAPTTAAPTEEEGATEAFSDAASVFASLAAVATSLWATSM